MTDYNSALSLYKELQKNGSEHVDANLSAPMVMGTSVEALDEAVYGAYDGESDDTQSDGQRLLIETMKQIENGNLSEDNRRRIEENVKNSKIPSSILNEMLSNPLIDTRVGSDDIDEFASRVLKSSAGIQKASQIIERTESDDRKKNESRKAQQVQANVGAAQVDYGKIAEIVENAVASKFSDFSRKLQLNEAKSVPIGNIKVLQLKEDGTFLMLDTDSNVYECTLKYKGKNVKRK